MNKKWRYRIAAVTLSAAMLLTGCGKKDEEASTATTEAVNTPATLKVTDASMITNAASVSLVKDGMVKNPLTGLWIDEKYANKRPISIQIENTTMALPQYGISHADIIYEMYVEGGITRLMCIITEFEDIEKLEPIRSNRHYYDRKAPEYDTVHVFWGASSFANYYDLYDNHYPNLEFIDLIKEPGGYRDDTRYMPHNAYSTGEALLKRINDKGYSRTYHDYYTRAHLFKDEFSEINGNPAKKVSIGFRNNEPWFEYDEENKVYKRFEFGDPQIDGETGEQLTFTNILIQFNSYSDLEGYESAGSQDLDWSGSGDGFYISGGQVIPVTWKRGKTTTKWYTSDGKELTMNPGKTWISVYNNKEGVKFE